MPQIIILPHAELCPEGQVFEAPEGQTILDAAKANGIFESSIAIGKANRDHSSRDS